MITIADLANLISPGFTEAVLQDILRKKSGIANPVIKEIMLGSSSNKGDSYLSTVTRLTIIGIENEGSGDGNIFQVHVIIKSVPQSQTRAKSFRSLDFFGTEIGFYNKIWPQLNAFQRSKQLPELFESIPLCLATFSDGKTDFIVLEDLSYQGFKALDRSSSGLDLNTTLYILKYFAKFHGISVAYKEQHPEEFQKFDEDLKETYFDEKFREWYRGTMEKMCLVVKDAAEKELPPNYFKKIEEVMSQDLYGNICQLLKKRTVFSAVTHGDCWPPNFLVKEQDGSKEIALIDFQLTRVASLTTDILFLLCTCVDPTVLDKHWDHIISEYYENFIGVLKELGFKSEITLDMLKQEIKAYGLFAFGMCNEALIMSLMDDEDVADLDALEGDEVIPLHNIWKIEPIKDNEKRKRIADYLKHLINYKLI
ncbi:hypothetical protein Trydic_g7278 [Trypoxylus dichotomus]